LAGTSFETKDDYDFNVVNANDAMLLILQLTSTFCAQVGGPKAAPFEPLDFLQVGAFQRSRVAADYPGSMVIRALTPWSYGQSG